MTLREANYYSHLFLVPLPHRSQGKLSTSVACPTLKIHVVANFRFRDASCSIVELQNCNADLRADNFGVSA